MSRLIDGAGALHSLFNGTTEFVAFDLETTGLHPSLDRITEIGAVRSRLAETQGVWETLINPGRPISADASLISGITDEMVRDKPTIGASLPEFLTFVGDSPLVAHHARFDAGFLRAALLGTGLPLIANPIFDTRLFTRLLWPSWGKYGLADVLTFLGLKRDNLHRALADALACRDVFTACLRQWGHASTDDGGEWKIAFILTEDDIDETV